MKIKVPYTLNDNVMTSGRKFGFIKSISGVINENGVNHLVYDTSEVTRVRPNDIKGFDLLSTDNYKNFSVDPPLSIGQEVLYLNSTYDNIGILSKGCITSVEFDISFGYSIFWYNVGKQSGLDKYSVYLNKEDFIQRTKSNTELKENQRYIFTEYLMQQNNLVVVDIEDKTSVKAKIIKGYDCGRKIRKTFLYTSQKKFYNKMFSQI